MWYLQQKYLFRYHPIAYIMVLVLCMIVPVGTAAAWWLGVMSYSTFSGVSVLSAIVGSIIFRCNHPFAGWREYRAAGSIKIDITELDRNEIVMIKNDIDTVYGDETRIFDSGIQDSRLEFNSIVPRGSSTVLFGQIAHEYFEQHPYSFCTESKRSKVPYFEIIVWGSFAVSCLFYGFTLWPVPIVLSIMGYISITPLSFFIHAVHDKLRRFNLIIMAKRLRAGGQSSPELDEVKQFMEDMK